VAANAAWWVWAGNRAFRGIRAPRDVALGVQCVVAILLPVVGAAAVFRSARRQSATCDGPIAAAGGTALGLVVVILLYAMLLAGPI
jgi:hypothetical protein